MAQIVIDTNVAWKIIAVIALIGLAAMIGYETGKGSPVPGQIPNTTIKAPTSKPVTIIQPVQVTPRSTITKRFCEKLTFTNRSFQSPEVHYFNNGAVIPAGTYTLEVSGWYSPWDMDRGWLEEGETNQFKSAIYDNLAVLFVNGNPATIVPLIEIVNGTFDHENSKGSAIVNLSQTTQVGIFIYDTTYPGNRGHAVFWMKNSDHDC